MQGYILNVELISNLKFDSELFDELKGKMESREDFIAFYSVFLDFIQLNFNKFVEIYIEDYVVENDLQSDLEAMLKDLDSIIPGGLSNDSKIEWASSLSPLSVIWYKDNGVWNETVSENMEFSDEDWMRNDEYDSDPYEGRYPSRLDDDDNW